MEIKELKKTIWVTVKKLGNNLEPEAYLHMILGLLFLKRIIDTSGEKSDENLGKGNNVIASSSDKAVEEYVTYNEFFVPEKAKWTFLQRHASDPEIGILIDEVIDTIEKLNENIRGILPKNYSNPDLDQVVLGELIHQIGDIGTDKKNQEKKELLADVYEYLLKKFFEKDKNYRRFYTKQNFAKLLVAMVEPRKGVIYDGCCGTGSMFLQIEKHINKYRAKINGVAFYGQDSNAIVLKIAKMNLIIHDFDANLQTGDTFTNDCFPDIKADFILASPPPNQREWKADQLTNDQHWIYGQPPEENANYAWLQHFIYKLSPTGIAGIILPDTSLNSNLVKERKIRQSLIEAKLIDCIVTLPSQLFNDSEMPACLWILNKNKTNNKYRNSGNEILFIDARKLKVIGDRRNKELTDESVLLISRTYHRWSNINGDYIDLKRFCKAVTIEEVSKNKYSLLPARYIADRRVKKVIPVLFIIFLFALFFIITSKNSSFFTKPTASDTTISAEPKLVKDSLLHEKVDKAVKEKVKDEPVRTKDNSTIDSEQNKSVVRTTSVKKDLPEEVKKDLPEEVKKDLPEKVEKDLPKEVEKDLPEEVSKRSQLNSYQVISKAYFYDEPDESTRRKAFITHWNNAYAIIESAEEKNGFIYVEFKNHLNQTSKGWLRKKDLKEVDQ